MASGPLQVKDANTVTQPLSAQVDIAGSLAVVHVPAAVVAGIATPVSADAPLPVQLVGGGPDEPSLDGSGSIAVGLTAQILFSGVAPVNGFLVANPAASGDPLYVNDAGTALIAGAGSIPVNPGETFATPAGYTPIGPVSIIAATTGDKFTARRW